MIKEYFEMGKTMREKVFERLIGGFGMIVVFVLFVLLMNEMCG
jgi:hypothetical protein